MRFGGMDRPENDEGGGVWAVSKVSITVISGSREKLQFAAMMASVAAVSAYEVTVFLSMNALPHFLVSAPRSAPAEGEIGRLIEEKNVPEFVGLFEQAAELGDAKIHPCSMAVDILAIGKDDLLPFLAEPMGLTKFLTAAEGGQCWSF
jgi:peroxiredoxin family protein